MSMKIDRKNKVVYYTDDINDDTSRFNTRKVSIDDKYSYLPTSILYKFSSGVFYYFFAKPLLYFITIFIQKIKVRGIKNIRKLKNTGYIIYCNHTHFSDAYIMPTRITGFKRTYIICDKLSLGIPIINKLVKGLGGLPVPDTKTATVNLNKVVDSLLEKKKAIVVYPEAHIWKYFTGTREFSATSFKFASRNNVPVVPIAVTYEKHKFLGRYRKPRMIYNIGEPIYSKVDLNVKENAQYLRDETFTYIKNVVGCETNYSYYKYIKTNPEDLEKIEIC